MGSLWGGRGYLTGQVEGPEKIDLKETLARSIWLLPNTVISLSAWRLQSVRLPSPSSYSPLSTLCML